MKRFAVFLIACTVAALNAGPVQAHFLFARILPHAEAGRAVEVFFSDRPDAGDPAFIDKIAHTKLWAQTEPNQFQPLTLVKASDRLRGSLPSAGTLAVVGACEYGVLARPKQPAFLLRHFPKAIAGEPKTLQTFAPKRDIPFEMMFAFDGEQMQFWTRHERGVLVPEEFVILGTSPKSTKLKPGKDGKVAWKPEAGRFVVYAGLFRKEAGTAGEQKYEQIREFCTLEFSWPLVRTEAEPAALKLFQDAIAHRAAWANFPGFSAEVTAHVDGRSAKGEVTISPNGDVSVSTFEEIVGPWVKDQLDFLVLHRLAAPSSGKKTTPIVYFGDDGHHPLGRLVVFQGGKFASSYRVKDSQLMVVNRNMGKTNMTITILENDKNADGKVLPRSYTVQYWDAATGQLKGTEAIHERWTRADGLDVPVSHSVIASSSAGLSVRTFTLSKHAVKK
jgi:hypothetical protein